MPGAGRVQQLQRWLSDNGVILHEELEITEQRDRTLSVSARAPLERDVCAAKIPKSALLSRRNCSGADVIEQSLVGFESTFEPLIRLALLLLKEKQAGERSRWAGYISSLPESVPIAALWPTSSPARAWLKGTPADAALQKQQHLKKLDEAYASCHAHLKDRLKLDLSLADLCWAYSIVSSRAFIVDDYHKLSLVPLADLFNHTEYANVEFVTQHWVCAVCGSERWCEHDADDDDDDDNDDDDGDGTPSEGNQSGPDDEVACEMWTCEAIAQGEEAFNSYGEPLDSARCLIDYGFLDEGNSDDTWTFRFDSPILRDAGLTRAHLEKWRELIINDDVLDNSLDLLVESFCDFDSSYDAECQAQERADDGQDSLDDLEDISELLLMFGSDARMSRPLWHLIAIMSCPAGLENKDPAKLAWAQFKLIGGQDQFISDSSDEEAPATANSTKRTLLPSGNDCVRAFARKALEICAAKRATLHEPRVTAKALLERADQETDERTKLAMRYSAGERRLIECIERRQQDYLDATAHLDLATQFRRQRFLR